MMTSDQFLYLVRLSFCVVGMFSTVFGLMWLFQNRDTNTYRLSLKCMERFRLALVDATENKRYYIMPIYKNQNYALIGYTLAEIIVKPIFYSSFRDGNVKYYSEEDSWTISIKDALKCGFLNVDDVVIENKHKPMKIIEQSEYDSLIAIKKEYDSAMSEIISPLN